jgi:hypothetical protein
MLQNAGMGLAPVATVAARLRTRLISDAGNEMPWPDSRLIMGTPFRGAAAGFPGGEGASDER